MSRRVVVTGVGAVTPVGCDAETSWRNIIAGKSGIEAIRHFDASDISCRVAGVIVDAAASEYGLDISKYMSPKEQRKVDRFIAVGVSAAIQAIEDSGWIPDTLEERNRSGVLMGSGIGGLATIEATAATMAKDGPRRVSPFFIPATLINLLSGHVSIKYGLRALNCAVVTACATGAHAIGEAARAILSGDADVMVSGSAEAAVCRLAVAGFAAGRALSTSFNDKPQEASRPWDRDRDGFVMGEGAGALILEEYEHAVKRNAKIYGELCGYGTSGDAYHITAPLESGEGAYAAMHNALDRARLKPNDISYINAHGTSTPAGDSAELAAVRRLFDNDRRDKPLYMSSVKSSIGHLLGAAGSVEAIMSIITMNRGDMPPTLNLHNPMEAGGVDLLPLESKSAPHRYVMSNSFGFGGTNVSLIFRKM